MMKAELKSLVEENNMKGVTLVGNNQVENIGNCYRQEDKWINGNT